jgi:hypothetical protein
MMAIGMNPYQGLVSKQDFKRGKGMNPGTRGSVNIGGDHKDFVAVKIASGTWVNGIIMQIDSAGVIGTAITAPTAPPATTNMRLGILVFASATSTQTVAGTSYGFVQIYGQALAQVSTTVSLFGAQLVLGADPGQLINAAGVASTEAQLKGITAIGTQSVSGLMSVFLNYPAFSGVPDSNLA